MRGPTHTKRLSLAKCPKCGRVIPYRLKGPELYFKGLELYFKIQCKKCGNSVSVRERLNDHEADVLERARRTYDRCKSLLSVE